MMGLSHHEKLENPGAFCRSEETLKYMGEQPAVVPNTMRLSEFLGTRESPIIITEPQLEKRGQRARAQLRSIPFFRELGVDRFMYDALWQDDFQLVEHEYFDPSKRTGTNVDFPLIHLANSKQLLGRDSQDHGQEDISQAKITWDLLSAADQADEPYVLVCDTDAPKIPSETPVAGRPVADQFGAERFEYPQLVRDYVRDNVDSGIPLNETRNLFFHKVSAHHRENGLPGRSIPDLFDYEQAPADSPVWEPLYYFIEHELEELYEEYEAHIRESLRSWVEWGDTSAISRRMIAVLHRCDFDAEQLDDYRNSNDR